MLSIRSISSNISEGPKMIKMLQLEDKVASLDKEIQLLHKVTKSLAKLEDELQQTNFLIDSSIGSKESKTALRKAKKKLRRRRVNLWDKLAPLQGLETERAQTIHDLDDLRRRIGVL